MHLSLGQAAKETGMDKSTISRAIKSGKLSATRKENGAMRSTRRIVSGLCSPPPRKRSPQRSRPVPPWTDRPRTRHYACNGKPPHSVCNGSRDTRIQDKDEEIRDLRHRLDIEGEERRKLTLMLLASHHAEQPKEHEHQQGEVTPPTHAAPRRATCGNCACHPQEKRFLAMALEVGVACMFHGFCPLALHGVVLSISSSANGRTSQRRAALGALVRVLLRVVNAWHDMQRLPPVAYNNRPICIL